MSLRIMGLQRLLRALFVIIALVTGATVAVAQTTSDTGYILGPDDSIQVVVYGQTEFNITTRIKADGTIVMPLIGSIKAAGLSNVGLANQIGDQLSKGGLLKSPIVNVEIVNYLSKTANVAGKVTAPGIIALDRPYRALEALLKAGWVRDVGASYVVLRRAGQAETRLEIDELVRGGPDKDPVLRAGDTLFVPDADLVYLTGQVSRPGAMPILPNMTIRQALAAAGGVTATGSANKVGLVRGSAKEIDVDTTQPVQKNDVIVVKERLF
jgi:polysaccharide biosynthesis/export protein